MLVFRREFRRLFWIALGLVAPWAAEAQPFETLVDFVRQNLPKNPRGDYMARRCESIKYPGWENYPTKLCRYEYQKKLVPVIMLNPDNERAARWIAASCLDAGAQFPKHCAERLALRIKCQSGYQFPVAGFVDEGPLFTFRDGVTVTIRGIGHSSLNRVPNAQEQGFVLNSTSGPNSEVEAVHQFARIQGTTRGEYRSFVGIGAEPVDGQASLNWQNVIRKSYQAAWTDNRYSLMSAWARANKSSIDHKLEPAAHFSEFCKNVASGFGKPERAWKRWSIIGE